jgi:hypothetical protein
LFFSFFFFQVRAPDFHLLATSITMSAILLYHLDLDQPISIPHLEHRVSPLGFIN